MKTLCARTGLVTSLVLIGLSNGQAVSPALAKPAANPAMKTANSNLWDVKSDTWVATDALGRSLPAHADVGPPRPNKFVGIFYFLWLGEHGQEGPFDITKILQRDPDAINQPQNPLWGPVYAPHHWGEPAFGYYLSNDEWVLRRHAQMLSDAGVDVVIFDVTNQFTYPRSYGALCRVWSQIRREGGRTPQIAFLTPFWEPARVVRTLYDDFYKPGLYADLWFRWRGKPLIMADPNLLSAQALSRSQRLAVKLDTRATLGQSFTASRPFKAVGGEFPTWSEKTSAVTLSLYRVGRGGQLPGRLVARRRFENVQDNARVMLEFAPLPPGHYYLEQSQPKGQIGWWSHTGSAYAGGRAFADRVPAEGDRTLAILYDGQQTPAVLVSNEDKPDAASESARGESKRVPERLPPGSTLGQSFTASAPFTAAGGPFPTYYEKDSSVTLSLYAGGPNGGPGGKLLARRRFENVADGATLLLEFADALPPGAYYLEQSEAKGQIGWWSETGDVTPGGQAFAGGRPVAGDRQLAITYDSPQRREILNFFTFRKPRPDYFGGPDSGKPGEWGWLDVFPQKVYRTPADAPEQMTVGVAQNAVDGKLSVLSNPRAHGRSFHDGAEPPPEGQDFTGRNFAEQWEHALAVDPEFVFVTGWNEWIAGRFPQNDAFHAMGPVSFVDQFNHEYSRDIEPVRGGHTDSYYYQLVSYVRRFKGVRAPETAGPPRTMKINGDFAKWRAARPEFRDHKNDTTPRNHPGWGKAGLYRNATGRNDFVRLKVAHDARNISFYAQTARPITSFLGPHWMMLFLDTDGDARTGWQGFDFVLNRRVLSATQTTLEAHGGGAGGWRWKRAATISYRVRGNQMELAIPRAALKLSAGKPLRFNFQWMDNVGAERDLLNLYTNGDAAPGGRFRYRYAAAAR